MNKLVATLGGTLAICSVALSCSSGTHAAPAPSATPTVRSSIPVPSPSPTKSGLDGLTDRQLAGQRVIYSYSGLTPPASLLQDIRAGEVGGVIFFGPNIAGESQIRAVVGELEAAAAQSPIKSPLLLMTDQEGGEVRRLPGAPGLSEKQIGEGAAGLAAQAGTSAGNNLRGVGMNVNLAPVLDVFHVPGGFDDQFQRSYSSNPHVASRLGAAFINAQQRTGVAATAKHFPGLGTAAMQQNTDLRPVTLNASLATLRRDEAPFAAAIAAHVKLIMLSWAVYPAMDAGRPAGLSAKIVNGELRRRLGYTGVTITDSLGAGALNAYGTPAQRAVKAAQAGMDLILASGNTLAISEGDGAVNGLATALRDGTLNRADFLASVQRVLALRAGLAPSN